MRAIHITTLDGPEAVELVDVPAPADPRLVTIEVRACLLYTSPSPRD